MIKFNKTRGLTIPESIINTIPKAIAEKLAAQKDLQR